jgi:hypothetical protein
MSRKRIADLFILAGLSVAAVGVALLFSVAAAIVLVGIGLAAFGALIIQVGP